MKRISLILFVLLFSGWLLAENAWINEFHYDNIGTDTGEMIEVVVNLSGSEQLSDFSVYFYNGAYGTVYNSLTLDQFTVGTTVDSFLIVYCYPDFSIQNGAPDGIALAVNDVLIPGQFLSYEGVFDGVDGVAAGVTSIDIGVEETGETEAGMTLQLAGEGSLYSDFYWVAPATVTPGQLNNNQLISGEPAPAITVTSPNGGEEWEQGTTHNISWVSVNFEGNVDIELIEMSGSTSQYLATDIENTGMWEWVIPEALMPLSTYKIGVSGVLDGDPADMSDSEFSIIGAIPVTDVGTIADLRQGTEDGTIYRLTGEAVLTFQQNYRHQKFVQDSTAAILIDDVAGIIQTAYEMGDGIKNLTGTLSEYGGMLEFVPFEDSTIVVSHGNLTTPEEITLTQLNTAFEDYESELVLIKNVTFTDAGSTFVNGMVYEISDDMASSSFRTTFYDMDYIGTEIPSGSMPLIGICNSRTDGEYISSRNLADLYPAGLMIDHTILEFLTNEDIPEKHFTVYNISDMPIEIISMNNYGSLSDAIWEIQPWDIELPYMLEAGDSIGFSVMLGLPLREIIEDTIYIETADETYEVTIRFNTDLNSDAEENTVSSPAMLLSNYPNPFNPETTIAFTLNTEYTENTEIVIYNVKGQKVKTLVNKVLPEGEHTAIWKGEDDNGRPVASGVYFYQLKAGGSSATRKMLLLK